MSVRPLSSELQKIAENELGEVPSRVQEDVQHIRDWLAKQPHLNAKTDDQWILTFLRGCKFSLQRTKKKLDLYYTMKTLLPEFFSNRDPLLPDIQEYLNRGIIVPLLKTNSTGQALTIIRASTCDKEKLPWVTALKGEMMSTDISLNENDNIMAGLHVLIDLKDIPYNYVTCMSPALIKKSIVCIQEAYPLRLKGFHLINFPPFCYVLLNVVKSCLSEKLRRRIFFYDKDNIKDLYKYFPLCVLPKEYGGEAGSIDDLVAYYKLKVESYRQWFLDDEKYRSDETKRPGKPVTSSDMFGVEGSFKQIAVD